MALIDKYPFNLLTDYQIEGNNITEETKYEIFDIPARELICPGRFDLLAKWIYIHAREKGAGLGWATEVYRDSIDAFSAGSFMEPGSPDKNSFQSYLAAFGNLIDDIKVNGVDCTKSLIPIGKGNVLLDGAHRVSVAAYYGQTVRVIKFPDFTRNMNYEYFRKQLMCESNMAHMARLYSHLKGNCYMACLWPKGDKSKHEEAIAELSRIGKIVYVGDVYLTYNGMKNFMVQIYGHQAWTGSIENGFSGSNGKASACYNRRNPIKTVLFEATDFDKVVEVKSKIRQIYGIDNHSIHISDNQAETEMMAELLYSENSVKFLNYAQPYRFKHIFCEVPKLRTTIEDSGYELERFVVDSSAVLEVYGIREARDIDYLTDVPESESNLEGIDRHDSQLKYYGISVPEMLYDPRNYFIYYGMKFLDIDCVLNMKKTRDEDKDRRDIKLARGYFNACDKVPGRFRAETRQKILSYMKEMQMYGREPYSYSEYVIERIKRPFRRITYIFRRSWWIPRIRESIIRGYRKSLKNTDFSLISSNCNGGVVCSDLGLQFKSPFVNLFLTASDYIKLLQDLDYYMAQELVFTDAEDERYGAVDYPVAYLADIKIYFMHYRNKYEAERIWNYRKKRLNKENLFIIFTDKSGCTQKDLEAFDRLPYKNKVVFTHIPHPEIKSSFYIRGYESEDSVGVLSEYRSDNSVKRMLYQFDFVKWFNEGRSRGTD